MPSPVSNREILSVSDLTHAARRLLEGEFPMVFVEGEISNFSTPASGHWYFTLKDDRSQLRCAMFRNRNRLIKFVPRNGLQTVVRGRISLYEGRGEFQMIAEFMEEAGDGALRKAYEALKTQLQSEGLFDEANKRQLPGLSQHIAIITSPTGAAVRDVLHVMQRRFPAIHVSIIPVQVQGEESVKQIVAALDFANRYETEPFDIILLTRGGGSLEDLWSFNTEPVARAIFASDIPVVSAIGHETDITIADFVADLRAATPSAAAELISPDKETWETHLSRIENTLISIARRIQSNRAGDLQHLQRRLRHPGQRLQDLHQRLDDLEARLSGSFKYYLAGLDVDNIRFRLLTIMKQKLEFEKNRLIRLKSSLISPAVIINQQGMSLEQLKQRLLHQASLFATQADHRLSHVTARLDGVSPLRTLDRGYAIITRAESDMDVVRQATTLTLGDKVRARLKLGSFVAEVTEIETEE